MIKQIWFIRNKYRLINYLSYSINLLILFYTSLNLLVLEDNIGLKFDKSGNALITGSKYFLLIIPIVALACNILIYYLSKSKINFNTWVKITDKNKAIQQNLSQITLIGVNFILSLIFTFIQVNFLNNVKGLQSFSFFPIFICIIMLIGFLIYMTIKSFKNK